MTAPHLPMSSPPPSLGAYLRVLRRGWLLVAAAAVLTAIFAALPAALDDAVHSSTARVRVSPLGEPAGLRPEGRAPAVASDGVRELLTEVEILRSGPMRAAVVAAFDGAPPAFGGPSVQLVGLSEIVEITVTSSDPAAAAQVANTWAEVFVEDRRQRSGEALLATAAELRDQRAEVAAELEAVTAELAASDGLPAAAVAGLQAREATLAAQVRDLDRLADELEVEVALRARATQVISPAQPSWAATRAGWKRPMALGAALGLLLGVTLVVVLDLLRDRVGGRDDLAAVARGVPVLAAVPHGQHDPAGAGRTPAAREAFRYLRAGVRVFDAGAGLRSVVVTSAVDGEGKTTTAVGLARAMAEAGDRVVLVDCDLRRPALHQRLGLANDRGLTTVATGDGDPGGDATDALQRVDERLAVLTAGPAVPDPSAVLGSERVAAVLAWLAEQADLVVLDSPPVLAVVDALVAGRHVDGALAVARVGMVRRREVRDLVARLADAGVPLVGLVANDAREATPRGYDGDPAPAG